MSLSFFGRLFAAPAIVTAVGLITSTPWLFWIGSYFCAIVAIITIVGANPPATRKDWFDELKDI